MGILLKQRGKDFSSECTPKELSCISTAIKTLSSGGNFLEIGTAAGGTLKEIINTADKHNLLANYFVLDPLTYFPNQLEKVHHNLLNSNIDPTKVKFWEGTTESHLLPAIEKGFTFNFIFVDGDHKAFPVMLDIQWMELLSVGGIACFHDYNDKFPGVVWALNRFLKKNDQFKVILRAESLIVVKRDGKAIQPVTQFDLFVSKFMQVFLRVRRSIKKRLPR